MNMARNALFRPLARRGGALCAVLAFCLVATIAPRAQAANYGDVLAVDDVTYRAGQTVVIDGGAYTVEDVLRSYRAFTYNKNGSLRSEGMVIVLLLEGPGGVEYEYEIVSGRLVRRGASTLKVHEVKDALRGAAQAVAHASECNGRGVAVLDVRG